MNTRSGHHRKPAREYRTAVSNIVWLVLLFLSIGCVSARDSAAPGSRSADGLASYYSHEFAGRSTANGEIFDPERKTAAHRTLPFGTLVRVTNLQNGRTVVVRINDRGPFVEGRIIDLSLAAARDLKMIQPGVVPVSLERIESNTGDYVTW